MSFLSDIFHIDSRQEKDLLMKFEGIAFISYKLLARKMTVFALMDLDKNGFISGHLFFQCRKINDYAYLKKN